MEAACDAVACALGVAEDHDAHVPPRRRRPRADPREDRRQPRVLPAPYTRVAPPSTRAPRQAGGGRRQAHRPASRGLRRAPHSCQCHHSRPASGGVVQRPAPRVYPSCAGPGHGQRFPFLSFPPLTSPSSASLSQQELSGEGEGEAYLRGAPLLLRRGGSSEEALLLQDLSGPAHLPRGLPGGHGLPGLITASAPRSACLSEAPERGALT